MFATFRAGATGLSDLVLLLFLLKLISWFLSMILCDGAQHPFGHYCNMSWGAFKLVLKARSTIQRCQYSTCTVVRRRIKINSSGPSRADGQWFLSTTMMEREFECAGRAAQHSTAGLLYFVFGVGGGE